MSAKAEIFYGLCVGLALGGVWKVRTRATPRASFASLLVLTSTAFSPRRHLVCNANRCTTGTKGGRCVITRCEPSAPPHEPHSLTSNLPSRRSRSTTLRKRRRPRKAFERSKSSQNTFRLQERLPFDCASPARVRVCISRSLHSMPCDPCATIPLARSNPPLLPQLCQGRPSPAPLPVHVLVLALNSDLRGDRSEWHHHSQQRVCQGSHFRKRVRP